MTHPALAARVTPDSLGDAIAATVGQVLVVIDDLQRLEDSTGIEAALKHRDRVLSRCRDRSISCRRARA